MTKNHNYYLDLAYQLAEKNLGKTGLNPSVGAIVVKDDSVISSGVTSPKGRPHAEFNALSKIKKYYGASLYTSLEPCVHYGKTPPCTEIISKKKIKKVYFGSFDPDNDISSYKWTLLEGNKVILSRVKGYYNFEKHDKDIKQKIILTVTDSKGLVGHDTLDVNIINDKAPIANAGENFIAPFNKYVNLDGSNSIDDDSDLKYFWNIISNNASFIKGEETKLFDNSFLTCT